MCAIGRAFVARHPNWGYSRTCDEFREMTAIYIGAPAPLAAQLGFGNQVRSIRPDCSYFLHSTNGASH